MLLEYPLLRLGRRIDAVLLTDSTIVVLEFKVGREGFNTLNRQQAEDYALDLVDFHAGSRSHPVVPVLVATEATKPVQNWPLIWFGATPVLQANSDTLTELLAEVAARVPASERRLHISGWEAAPYSPVPTIVEAARMLYTRHGVAEIASSRADVGNLTGTTQAISLRSHMHGRVTRIPLFSLRESQGLARRCVD